MKVQVDGYTSAVYGHKGDVGARFERLPYYLKDGKRRFSHPDFGSELIEALYNAMPPEPKRLLFGAGKCQNCGSKLPDQPRSHSFALRLEIPGLEPIDMRVEIPAVACPVCATEHRMGERDTEAELSGAMIAAFGQAGLTY